MINPISISSRYKDSFSSEISTFKNLFSLFSSREGSFSELMESLIFGKEGSYKIFEVPVYFVKKNSGSGESIIDDLFRKCFFLTAYTCIHEMGHALAAQAFGLKFKVLIYTNVTSGIAGYAIQHESFFL